MFGYKSFKPRLTALLFMIASAAVAGDSGDVSGVLFEHVMDGHELEIIPGVYSLPLPLGITVHLLMLWLAAGLLLALFVPAFRRPALKIRGLAGALEAVVVFIRDDIVYPVMGPERGLVWLPFFSTLMLFLLTMNLLGLIPLFKAATGNINVTAAMAMVIMVLVFATGVRRLGFSGFFKNLAPHGAPAIIGIFIAFLELIGVLVKSRVLSLRLFANMFAGHLVILSFLALIFLLSPWFATLSVPFALFAYLLEILVAVIQAVVFTLLSCIFISMASSAH